MEAVVRGVGIGMRRCGSASSSSSLSTTRILFDVSLGAAGASRGGARCKSGFTNDDGGTVLFSPAAALPVLLGSCFRLRRACCVASVAGTCIESGPEPLMAPVERGKELCDTLRSLNRLLPGVTAAFIGLSALAEENDVLVMVLFGLKTVRFPAPAPASVSAPVPAPSSLWMPVLFEGAALAGVLITLM